jgi:hypothetical protein
MLVVGQRHANYYRLQTPLRNPFQNLPQVQRVGCDLQMATVPVLTREAARSSAVAFLWWAMKARTRLCAAPSREFAQRGGGATGGVATGAVLGAVGRLGPPPPPPPKFK